MNYCLHKTSTHVCFLSRLNGSYEALEYGFEADAFTDLTGGLAEWYNPADLKDEDFYLVRAAFTSGAVIGCLSVVSNIQHCRDINMNCTIIEHVVIVMQNLCSYCALLVKLSRQCKVK